MDVRRFLLEHQIEERINLCHTGDNSGMTGQELNWEQLIKALSGVAPSAGPFRREWNARRDFSPDAPDPASP
jgi:hypothetical protein